MFAKWFGSRAPRPLQQSLRFRPKLELLESRLAPSSLFHPFDGPGNGHGNGNGNGNGDGNGGDDNGGGDDQGGGEPPGQQRFMNNFDNFDLEDDNGFQIVLNNLNANQFFTVGGIPPGQLGQVIVGVLDQVMMTGGAGAGQNAIALITNEFQLAQDTVALIPSVLSGTTPSATLLQDIHNLQAAIQSNPLEATAAGQVLGAVSFDIGLNLALAGSQFGGQLQGHGQGHG